MAIKIQSMTKSQLAQYFNDYRSVFLDWEVEHEVVLARSSGPLKQYVAFEALRSGAYRPSHSIEILIAPGVHVLTRFLDIKHREVLPREHAAKWPRVVSAMEEQFVPSIRRPLDVVEVLHLTEEEVLRDRIEKTHYSVALAAMNAFTGNFERAIWWCNRVPAQLAQMGRDPADWERSHADYAEVLRKATNDGLARQFLMGKLGH